MNVLDAVTLDLPPTATYSRREAQIIPGDEPGEFDLILTLWKGKRAGSKQERDHYGVMEEQANPGWRTFLVLNRDDPTQPDCYRVVVGRVPQCSCKAGLCRLACKHRAAIEAGIAEGVI